MRLCALGSGEEMMRFSAWQPGNGEPYPPSPTARRKKKEDTSSTTNDEEDHCPKQEGGCKNNTTCSVEYSSLGPKTDGAEPSVSIWGAGSVLLQELWAPGARDESGPTDPGLVPPSLIGDK